MTEFKDGLFNVLKRSSAARAIVYTLGHFIIAALCNFFIAGASFHLAAVDAVVEPIINGVWYYALDKLWSSSHA